MCFIAVMCDLLETNTSSDEGLTIPVSIIIYFRREICDNIRSIRNSIFQNKIIMKCLKNRAQHLNVTVFL